MVFVHVSTSQEANIEKNECFYPTHSFGNAPASFARGFAWVTLFRASAVSFSRPANLNFPRSNRHKEPNRESKKLASKPPNETSSVLCDLLLLDLYCSWLPYCITNKLLIEGSSVLISNVTDRGWFSVAHVPDRASSDASLENSRRCRHRPTASAEKAFVVSSRVFINKQSKVVY
jgi:hypothetical protein